MGLAGFEVEVQRPQADGGLSTEDMTLSMGPQHPSTHGVLRFVVRADGEVMKEAIPDIGYLHRSIEKIAEKVGWHGFMPYTDRVDYVAAMTCNQGWAMAAERLAAIEVPKRGEYCRVIATEFSRIHSLLLSVGSMAMDIGAYTFFFQAEDGIRDYKVTGVQTCALPILVVSIVRVAMIPGMAQAKELSMGIKLFPCRPTLLIKRSIRNAALAM